LAAISTTRFSEKQRQMKSRKF